MSNNILSSYLKTCPAFFEFLDTLPTLQAKFLCSWKNSLLLFVVAQARRKIDKPRFSYEGGLFFITFEQSAFENKQNK